MANKMKTLKCSFCNKGTEDGIKLVTSPQAGICICNECVDLAHESIHIVDAGKDIREILKEGFKPDDVIEFLKQYVIGQDVAKEVLAVAVFNHYKMLSYKSQKNPDVEMDKSNILIAGPTGTGKTFLARMLARFLNVPFAISDATTMTAAGYVGEDVENCVRKLIEAADGDIEKAQNGIIYIDEIDKNSRKGENVSITRDVGGESVQQALLKIVEGAEIEVAPKGQRKHPGQESYKIDTTNILFIVGGSFEGIEKIVEKRLKKASGSSVGFTGKVESKNEKALTEYYKDITVDDLKKYGMLPEFLGRFPVICSLEEHSHESLVKILTEPKNALIKQYKELFKMDGIEIEFTSEALHAIADKALKRGTGARGLRGILEDLLRPSMRAFPNDPTIRKAIFDEKCVTEGTAPKVEKEEAC